MKFIELSKGTMACEDKESFLQNLLCRIFFMWLQKALLSISMIALFFYFYFYFLQHNLFEMTTIPKTWIDELVSFDPIFFYVYVSLWVYLSLSMAIIKNKEELRSYLLYLAALGTMAILFYIFFPTTIIQDIHTSKDDMLQIIKDIDMAGNAFPSMHVASSLFAFIWLHMHLKNIGAPLFLKLFNAIWFALIVYSTMAINQHLFIDVLGGILFGLPVSLLAIKKFNSCGTLPRKHPSS
ncbi:MAG: phosphatase PAP2 family protein [Campylobacterales bacterium]|nr:phosphatase PAP2 family protein [Campylobacterales bacterium]